MPRKTDWTSTPQPQTRRLVTSIALDDGSAKGTTISCQGDRGFARVLSKLSEAMKLPVGALVTEALEAYNRGSLDRVRASYPDKSLKELVIIWARLEGMAVGTLVRQALNDAYGPALAEAEIAIEKADAAKGVVARV